MQELRQNLWEWMGIGVEIWISFQPLQILSFEYWIPFILQSWCEEVIDWAPKLVWNSHLLSHTNWKGLSRSNLSLWTVWGIFCWVWNWFCFQIHFWLIFSRMDEHFSGAKNKSPTQTAGQPTGQNQSQGNQAQLVSKVRIQCCLFSLSFEVILYSRSISHSAI